MADKIEPMEMVSIASSKLSGSDEAISAATLHTVSRVKALNTAPRTVILSNIATIILVLDFYLIWLVVKSFVFIFFC